MHNNHCKLNTKSHGHDGWCIEPDLEYYICYTVYITETQGERTAQTVDFLPKEVTMSFQSSQELVTQAA
jgi:hypothetical protein